MALSSFDLEVGRFKVSTLKGVTRIYLLVNAFVVVNNFLGNTNFIDQIKLNKFYYLVIKWCEIGYKMA